jgi:putative endonuclease
MSGKESVWYLYMVRCRDGKLYTGIATDIDRRFTEHQSGKGAKYLRGRGPLRLAFKQKIGRRSSALKMERLVKKLPKSEKERIAAGRIDIDRVLMQRSKPSASPRKKAALTSESSLLFLKLKS